jgi:hypothetical protein
MVNAVANLLNGIIGGGSKDLSSWDTNRGVVRARKGEKSSSPTGTERGYVSKRIGIVRMSSILSLLAFR